MQPAAGYCGNCQDVANILDMEPLTIDVISLYRKPSQMRNWLTRYKGRDDEDDPYDPSCVPPLRGIIGRWLEENGQELARRVGEIDSLVVVPSTKHSSRHPLEMILLSLDLDTRVEPLLVRGPGVIDWRRPAPDAFAITGSARMPKRLLVVDDVYATGSRVNSAAHALRAAGHDVRGALEIARRVNPDFAAEVAEFWEQQISQPFTWRSNRTWGGER